MLYVWNHDRKKDDRLDWMYQGPAGQVSRDEYLMGRPIDKQITDQYEEPESGPSAETGLLPGSIFNPTTPASNLDLAAKIREDPLFEIRSVLVDFCFCFLNMCLLTFSPKKYINPTPFLIQQFYIKDMKV